MALGDFTVNLGQGLVQWQSLAFRKSADALAVKRYSPVLRPYNSTGEANFLRGGGITLGLGKHVEATVFGSLRRRDARVEASYVAGNEPVVTSLYTTGYHRTHSEWESRNRLRIAQWGGSARFSKRNIQVGVHGVASRFSSPLEKNDAPHNRYAIRGKSWWNLGIDYSYTYQNLHFFGETAAGRNGYIATVNGLMMSLDARLDAAIVWRSIAPQYQTLNGNAFTESTMPNNERGFYAGVTVRPWTGIRIDAYADNWYFPFMRYQVHGPAQGSDYLLQVLFKPNKQVEWYIRYRKETREQNSTVPEGPVYPLTAVPRQNLRAHVAYKINPAITLFQRAEMVWVNRGASNGFTLYAECVYQPQLKPFSANMRVQYFETTDYSSRVYAYEHDVLYSYSVPALYGKGARYYANVQYDITRRLSFWFRWSQTIYREQETIGSGLDELPGNRRSEFRVQVRWVF